MPVCASTGPVIGRCWQHQPSTGPVLAHNGLVTGRLYYQPMPFREIIAKQVATVDILYAEYVGMIVSCTHPVVAMVNASRRIYIILLVRPLCVSVSVSVCVCSRTPPRPLVGLTFFRGNINLIPWSNLIYISWPWDKGQCHQRSLKLFPSLF